MSADHARPARPEPRSRDEARELERVGPEKAAAAPPPSLPLVHPALAFAAAAAATVVAGYTSASASAWCELYRDVGLSLPALVEIVIGYPVATPAALVLASAVVLLLGALHSKVRAARWVSTLFAVATGAAAVLLFGGQVLAFLVLDQRV
jgi:hypothetical protein